MFLLILLLVGLAVWLAIRSPLDNPKVKNKIYQVNQQWMVYLAMKFRAARDPEERKLLLSLIRELELQQRMPSAGLTVEDGVSMGAAPNAVEKQALAEAATDVLPSAADIRDAGNLVGSYQSDNLYAASQASAQRPALDNTTLLLYFGAFLLVVAAGLFVAFGGATGGVRTIVTALVMLAFYFGGNILWRTKPVLRPAGMTFAAIGIILAPLVGVAAYNYTEGVSPQVIWLLTSVVCLGLYAHAYFVYKNPLLEYVLIGTLVSLFESIVGVIDAPVYYYGWALAVTGLLLRSVQLWQKRSSFAMQSVSTSAHILMPVSIFASLFLLADTGFWQLGVTLLIASLYYGLLARYGAYNERALSSVAAQTLGLCGLAVIVYQLHWSTVEASVALLIAALPQIGVVMYPRGKTIENFAMVLLASLAVSVFLAWSSAELTAIALLGFVITSIVFWLRQKRADGFMTAALASLLLTQVVAYRLILGIHTAAWSSTLLLALLVLFVIVLHRIRGHGLDTSSWRSCMRPVLVVTATLAMVTSAFWTASGALVVGATSIALLSVLVRLEGAKWWAVLAGGAWVVPLVAAHSDGGVFAIGIWLALGHNLFMAFRLSSVENQAFATTSALMIPYALEKVGIIDDYSTEMVAYLGVVGFCILLRAVAHRLSCRLTSPGNVYVVGYCIAAFLAVMYATKAGGWLPLITCTTLAAIAAALMFYVEKEKHIVAGILPLVLLGWWLSYGTTAGDFKFFVLVSAAASVGGYGIGEMARLLSSSSARTVRLLQGSALITLVLLVCGYVSHVITWPLPWSLFIAGLLLLHFLWHDRQGNRELAGGVVFLGIAALMYFYGVNNVQAYTHSLAALFALYAFWRVRRQERAASDIYVVLMLAVSTVPLVVQAMSGAGGDLYGWWLLLEQVGIMLIGMVLRRRFMIRWGLYVAVGSVIWQLRSLGWAALGVLALFLIGLAVYYLMHQDKKPQP